MKVENIKFRGKSKRTDIWLYGDLVRDVEGAFVIVPPFLLARNDCCGNYEVPSKKVKNFY